MDVGIEIIGDRKVELKFDQFPQEAHSRLLARITELTAQLLARVQLAEPVRTGKLRNATRRVHDDPDRITGVVSVTADFGKAAALEYGAHGTTNVAQHMARLDHVFQRLIAPMTVVAKQHTRKLNIAEHRFLRGSEADISSDAIQAMQQALVDAVEANP